MVQVGRTAVRPYIVDNQNGVEMVGHDLINPQFNLGADEGRFLPFLPHDLAPPIQPHHPVHHLTEQPRAVMRHQGDKIRPRVGIIEGGQAGGAAGGQGHARILYGP
jgi:hypothetical protein